MTRVRFVYFVVAVMVVVAGLASRAYQSSLPTYLAEYAGDTLWSLMLFLLVSAVQPSQPIGVRAVITFIVAFLVEVSQLYHAPWIDTIRRTTLGGLVLGFGFLWTDLVCYTLGIAIGVCAEWTIGRYRVAQVDDSVASIR